MSFDWDNHTLEECQQKFGGPGCWRCNPKIRKPDFEMRVDTSTIAPGALKIIFGERS